MDAYNDDKKGEENVISIVWVEQKGNHCVGLIKTPADFI